tara:strand:+ start:178 stop:375 length:198 start_codon:yes stop_codon:yes gene_type:complete
MRSSRDEAKEAQQREREKLLQEYIDNGGRITVIGSNEYQQEGRRLSTADMSRRRYEVMKTKKVTP